MKKETVENVIGDLGLVGLFVWLWLTVWRGVTS